MDCIIQKWNNHIPRSSLVLPHYTNWGFTPTCSLGGICVTSHDKKETSTTKNMKARTRFRKRSLAVQCGRGYLTSSNTNPLCSPKSPWTVRRDDCGCTSDENRTTARWLFHAAFLQVSLTSRPMRICLDATHLLLATSRLLTPLGNWLTYRST